MTSNSEKKEKSLAEFVVIVALVGVLMAIFINFFIKNESQFAQAGFATIAQSFNTKVNAVHAQWLMDKQPNVVYLANLNNKQKQAIPVNRNGWIDVQQTPLACEAIWLLVMEVPITAMKFTVSVIEVRITPPKQQNKRQNKQKSRLQRESSECRYVIPDGRYFQYNRATGRVTSIIK